MAAKESQSYILLWAWDRAEVGCAVLMIAQPRCFVENADVTGLLYSPVGTKAVRSTD
jgi:hypothetical protein